MNVLSYNVRGLGSSFKRKHISGLLQKESFDLCLFQESKISSVQDRICFEVWGGTEVE